MNTAPTIIWHSISINVITF